jgi:diguanylate cyclase (GGDEF)-like protein/PAS domain S-box-containing protein
MALRTRGILALLKGPLTLAPMRFGGHVTIAVQIGTRLFTNEHHDFDESRMLTAATMSLTPSRLGKGMRMRSALESAFTHAPIGMALVDMAGRLLRVNDAMCRITGYARVEVCARSLRDLSDPRDVDIDAVQTVELLEGDVESYEVEKRYRHAWGHLVWVLLSVSLVRDDEGRPLYLIAQLLDISERKALEGRLEHLVDHDFLTALFNARYFERALAQETRSVARYGGGGAVLLLDLDHFKAVNDRFGHKVGDDLLKWVAATLQSRIRETDVLARLGGDEFGLILPKVDAGQAEVVASGLVRALRRETAMLAGRRIPVTASVGVGLFGALTDIEILAAADSAMYEAKEAGRDQCYLAKSDATLNLVQAGRGRAHSSRFQTRSA